MRPSKLLLLIALAILTVVWMTGCMTKKKCEAYCKANVKDSVRVERHDTTITKWRDTTVYLPGETVKIRDFVFCDSLNKAQMPKTKVKGKHLTATVEIKDNKLAVDCAEDSLIAVNAKLRDELRISKESTYHKQVVTVEKQYTAWYDIAARWVALLAFAYIGLRLLISKHSV